MMESEKLVSTAIQPLKMVLRMPVGNLSKKEHSRARKERLLKDGMVQILDMADEGRGLDICRRGVKLYAKTPHVIFYCDLFAKESHGCAPGSLVDAEQDTVGCSPSFYRH